MATDTNHIQKKARPGGGWLQRLPIRHKLVLVIMLVSSTTLFLASGAYVTYEWAVFRQRLVDDLSVQAEMLAQNSTAALSFSDPQDAKDVLASLSAKKSIMFACLYRRDGNVLATYYRNGVKTSACPAPRQDGYQFQKGRIMMFKHIALNNQPIGTVCLQSDLHELWTFLRDAVVVSGLLIALSTAVAFLLSTRLQKIISDPIFHLAQTAREVSQKKDYSVRAVKHHEDELGLLTDAFNDMLVQVQHRDRALRESEEKYRNILESLEDIYLELDLAGNLIFFNQSMCRMSGYGADELRGMNYRHYMDEQKAKRVFRMFNKVFRTGRTARVSGIDFIRKDGSMFTVEMLVSLIRGEDGNAVGFRGIARDISERKRAERDKRNLQQQLRHAQKMEAIGTLAGGIAHDFNNILSGIIGNAELAALYELPPEHPARHRLDQILIASKRATDLTRQILTFSRGQEFELKEVIVTPIIKEAVKLLRASLPTTIEIHLVLDAQKDMVFGDPSNIHQVIMNLCTNAAHAMRRKGGLLKISLTNQYFGTDACSQYPNMLPGNYLKLSVSDTGHGIAPSIKERIFEPYFTTKKSEEGTGLGLSVVHGIVKSFGGAITVESELEKGSTFIVFLPVVGHSETPSLESVEQFRTGSEHILLVDDEAQLLEIGKELLEKLGYRVTVKADPHDALELFELTPDEFDLVITDMTMPRLTGDRLAVALMKIRPDIPVILCTGYSKMITEEKAKSLGIRELVMKPLTMSKISHALLRVLDVDP